MLAKLVPLFMVLTMATGCADFQSEPFPDPKAIKEGPGLLTGPTGVFKIPLDVSR